MSRGQASVLCRKEVVVEKLHQKDKQWTQKMAGGRSLFATNTRQPVKLLVLEKINRGGLEKPQESTFLCLFGYIAGEIFSSSLFPTEDKQLLHANFSNFVISHLFHVLQCSPDLLNTVNKFCNCVCMTASNAGLYLLIKSCGRRPGDT